MTFDSSEWKKHTITFSLADKTHSYAFILWYVAEENMVDKKIPIIKVETKVYENDLQFRLLYLIFLNIRKLYEIKIKVFI